MKFFLSHTSSKAFSIIEVMVGIFIFSLWLVAIYALLISSLNLSDYNRHAIIASQLSVEQIEIVRNIRDMNYKELRAWDMLPSGWSLWSWYFTVENDFWGNHIDIQPINSFQEWSDALIAMQVYRLCITSEWIYTYKCASDTQETPYYRYLLIEEIWDESLRITSKVIWYARGYHEYDITTLITDWRRL